MNTDVIQIVDAYKAFAEGGRQAKVDPDGEAQSLSLLVKPLGRNDRKIAILAQEDERRILAYQRAGYETFPMNGSRPKDLRQFIRQMVATVKQTAPKHLVLVSDDPEFVHLCDAVAPLTDLAVWASSSSVPRELTDPAYGWRPLEELLPNLKIPRIDVRIDLENIFIGLVKRGWQPNLGVLVAAIRQAFEDLGEVTSVTGYADYDELSRNHSGANWQRELTLAGAETRYVVSQHGKNTADMKMAADVGTLVDQSQAGAIDMVGLVTMDRDFRHIVDTARQRGKRVVLLGLRGGLSSELERVANDVRYLDDYLTLTPASRPTARPAAPVRDQLALMMRIGAWMNQYRWRFVYRDRLAAEFGGQAEVLGRLIEEEWLVPAPGSTIDAQGQARTLQPNSAHALAQGAMLLARWIPARVDYCLRAKGMPHVDSNFLARGMTLDRELAQLNIGQTRAEAEQLLYSAATAGLVVAREQEHPQSPGRRITTWWLPEAGRSQQDSQTPGEAHSSPRLRQLLTHGLSDSELSRLLFDHFRAVYREVEGAPKATRIHALLDYAERSDSVDRLVEAIHEINPALADTQHAQRLAA